MQNKPNLPDTEVNVSKAHTEDYENKCLRRNRKNKANTNPIQSQFKAKTNPIKPNFKRGSRSPNPAEGPKK